MKSTISRSCLAVVTLCIALTAAAQKQDVRFEYGPSDSPTDVVDVMLVNDRPKAVKVKYKQTLTSNDGSKRVMERSTSVGQHRREFFGTTCVERHHACRTRISYELTSWDEY